MEVDTHASKQGLGVLLDSYISLFGLGSLCHRTHTYMYVTTLLVRKDVIVTLLVKYLSNKNKRCYSNFSPTFHQLNTPVLQSKNKRQTRKKSPHHQAPAMLTSYSYDCALLFYYYFGIRREPRTVLSTCCIIRSGILPVANKEGKKST
jgi:hypothetical protein